MHRLLARPPRAGSRIALRGVVAAFGMATAFTAASAQTIVPVEGGRIAGHASDGVAVFRGIPYAAPPVGPLRWRAPQPVVPWDGVRPAHSFGPDCMQKPFPSDAAPLGTAPAEDCLTLNVWRPAGHAAPRPVVIWIYGGGFVNGGASPAVYDGSAFARSGVVFVSFNYRLGRLGFFAHPALLGAKEGPVGNFGLMDQIAALRWVRANITRFGGDPSRVTVMGESAGGASVLSLIASPLAKGLFAQAVVMSGGGRRDMPSLRPAPNRKVASGEEAATRFARSLAIGNDTPDALARLRALPAAAIVRDLNLGNRSAGERDQWTNGPIVDGVTLPASQEAMMQSGAAHAVPLLIGTTDDDLGRYDATTKAALFAPYGEATAVLQRHYDPTGTAPLDMVGRALARDEAMAEPARFVARWTARAGQPAYLYRFAYVADALRGDGRGARHANEIPFFFRTIDARYGTAITATDRRAARTAHAALVRFIKIGSPGAAWPQVSDDDRIFEFDRRGNGRQIRRDDEPVLDLIERRASAARPGR